MNQLECLILFYHVCSLSRFFVVGEGGTIITVLQFVLRYPLVIVVSSLSCDTRYFDERTSQINLKPLIYIVMSC